MLINFDTALQTTPFFKHWQMAIGSGHAPLAMRTDYNEQLKFAAKELGFQSVRFHGIFNDDMNVGLSMRSAMNVKSADKFSEKSFYQIGKVYDNLLSDKVKPFVELGFMPSLMASGKKQCRFKYKGNITMPESLPEWSAFIENFIRFLVGRYGEKEVSSWYFEVWNEPNLPVFFAGSKNDYFRLYAATARAVKNICPSARVGGPATAASGWTEDFVDFCEANKAPYDFVSTHQYPGDPLGHSIDLKGVVKGVLAGLNRLKKANGGGILCGARQLFADDTEEREFVPDLFLTNAARIKKEIGGKPLLYTEWNANATCTAETNDTTKSSAYAVKTALDVEGVVDGSAFWCFSDIFEELAFFPYEFSGSFGLLTVDGIPKPSFWAFKLLSMLGENRYTVPSLKENGTEYAAFDKNGVTQILTYRQSFKQTDGKEKVVLKIKTDKHPEEVVIYRIDKDHSNSYEVWKQAGSVQNPSLEEIELIKSKSRLTPEKLLFVYADGCVNAEFDMAVNDVVLTEIR